MANPIQRLIQFVLRGKEELSAPAQKATEAMEALRTKTGELNQTLDSAKDARGLVVALGNTERAVAQTQTSIARADKTIVDLREALDKSPGSKGLEVSLKAAERDAANLRRTLDTLNAKHAEQQRAAKEAGVNTDKLADEEKRLAAEVASAKAEISENAKELQRLDRQQKSTADTADGLSNSIAAVRAGVTGAAVQFGKWLVGIYLVDKALQGLGAGITYLKDGITSMLQTGDQFENLQNRLTSLMGSVEGGEKATTWIKSFAKDTPLQLADVTDAFALLKAYGIDPMNGSLKAIEDQSEKLGGGMERLEGISTALGQAWAKEKLQTEEILQLIERGVPAWDMLAKVTGKNTEQLQELATKGRLGRDVIQELIAEMGRSSGGAAAKAMSTLTGLVSNLADTTTDFLGRIANAGALDYVKGRLKELAQTIAQMDADGRLDRLARALSEAFVTGSEKVIEFIGKLSEVDFGNLVTKAEGVAKSIGPAIDTVGTTGRTVVSTLTTVWNGFSLLVSSTAAALTKALQVTIGNLALGAGQIAGFFGGSELQGKAEGLYTFLGDLSQRYVDQAKTDLSQIEDSWDFLNDKAASSTQKQAEVVTEHFGDIKASAQDAAVASVQAVTSLQNALDQISAATTVAQLTSLQEEMRKAYSAGTISQQDYANGAAVLNTRLKELKGAAGSAALGVSDLSTGLESLKDVQAAISNARTSVDIQNIRTALSKLYNDGKISAQQFNQEQTKLAEKVKELKQAGVDGGKGMEDLADGTDKATKSLEEQRKEIGANMEAHRKGADDAKADLDAFAGFFGSVMSDARQPLAQLSAEALAAFDNLRGISATDIAIDTSSLDATSASLGRVAKQLGDVNAALNKVGLDGLSKWALENKRASLEIQAGYLGQKAKLQSLLDGVDSGKMRLKDFLAAARSARQGLGLLNDSDMRTLEGAIASAEEKVKQLGEGSKTTLASLREELAGLRGEQEAVDRSRFAGRRSELQTQLAEAQGSGDLNAVQNLSKALSTLREIEEETNAKRQRDEQQKRVDDQNAARDAAAKPAESSSGPPPTAEPMKIIRLETPRGPVNVGVEDDGTALLDTLEQFGMRTTTR